MMETGQKTTRRQPRGQALVTMALSLIVLMGFGALAIDVGMMFLARNELQNAADAAALAGVQELYYNGCTDCPQSRWGRAEDSAFANIAINKSMKATLDTGAIDSGWWNITGTPAGMQSKTKSPIVFGDAAAVRVVIRKAPGSNGGAVALLLASMFGAQATQTIQASAVGVVSFPGVVDTNTTFPTAINACWFERYWDRTTNAPKIDPETGAPIVFRIGSTYHYLTCDSGQWTTLLQDNENDVPAVRLLIENGNPDPLSVGQDIWIQPGTKSTIYDAVIIPTAAILPVVQDVSMSTHDQSPILGFAPFVITAVDKQEKWIEGHFEVGIEVPRSTGGGAFYGTVVPPSLAQ